MANTFYNPTGNPATGSDGLSALMRAEFLAISVAFDHMPQITTTGAFATVFNQQGNFTFTLPAAPGSLAMLSDVSSEASARAAADALLAPKDAPTFITSVTLSYTLPVLDNSDEAVSSKWVANFLAASGFVPAGASPVVTVASRTGNVVLTHADLTDWTAALITSASPLLRGHLGGLGLSNDSVVPFFVLDIAAGTCVDSTNTTIITLGAFTKSIGGTWTSGSGNNGMGVGVVASAFNWYHVYAAVINGGADVFFDPTFPPSNAPAGTTAHRRIGSFKLNSSLHIMPFLQTGDWFYLAAPNQEFSGAPGSTTGVILTLAGVPPGVVTQAIMTGVGSDTVAGSAFYLSSLAQTDVLPSGTAVTLWCALTAINSFLAIISTDIVGRIRRRSSSLTQGLTILTTGYIDTRGRG